MDIKTYVEQVTDKKKIEPYKVGFNLGLTHGLEIAVGFLKWYIENEVQTTWYEQFIYNDSTYTIDSLISQLKDQLK